MDGTDRLCVSERAQCIPCRVLHLRHLPADVSEQEVLALALPFGRVSKLITLKTKNQVSGHRPGRGVPPTSRLTASPCLRVATCWLGFQGFQFLVLFGFFVLFWFFYP